MNFYKYKITNTLFAPFYAIMS